jgi:hypothetical protein
MVANARFDGGRRDTLAILIEQCQQHRLHDIAFHRTDAIRKQSDGINGTTAFAAASVIQNER